MLLGLTQKWTYLLILKYQANQDKYIDTANKRASACNKINEGEMLTPIAEASIVDHVAIFHFLIGWFLKQMETIRFSVEKIMVNNGKNVIAEFIMMFSR